MALLPVVNIKTESLLRRVRFDDDGLVHATAVREEYIFRIGPLEGHYTYSRVRLCDFAAIQGLQVEVADVPDDPAPITCFGCLVGL